MKRCRLKVLAAPHGGTQHVYGGVANDPWGLSEVWFLPGTRRCGREGLLTVPGGVGLLASVGAAAVGGMVRGDVDLA
jgi:hypothetical protein